MTTRTPSPAEVQRAILALLELPGLETALGRGGESALRRLQVLACLEEDPIAVREIARRCRMSKSAASRHVLALQDAGLAERVIGGYAAVPAPRPALRIAGRVRAARTHQVVAA